MPAGQEFVIHRAHLFGYPETDVNAVRDVVDDVSIFGKHFACDFAMLACHAIDIAGEIDSEDRRVKLFNTGQVPEIFRRPVSEDIEHETPVEFIVTRWNRGMGREYAPAPDFLLGPVLVQELEGKH